MRAPYRIAVWGPGDVGSICLREAIRLPELEVVGALAYSDAKVGQDIGTIAGTDPIGITATDDVDAFLALDSDVVLHTALDYPGAEVLGDYVRLLEAGKNVITSHPYNNLAARDPAFRERLIEAAERGGATFHATGANPDFVAHRLMMTLTGFSNAIKQITIEEYFDCIDQANPGILQVIGLNGDPDQAMDATSPALWYQQQYWFQMIEQLAAELGVELSRIEATSASVPAPHRLQSPVLTIEPGRTGNVAYESIGYVGDEPFIRMRVGWYLTEAMKPAHVTAPCQWIFSIEGRPSSRTVMSIEPTLTDLDNMAGEPGAPGYVGFGITLIQAIPSVVAAPPGIKASEIPAVHWRSDMRLAEAAVTA